MYGSLGREGVVTQSEAYIEANKAIKKARELDETLPNIYNAQGLISMCYDWKWDIAEDNFKRAIDIDKSYMDTYTLYDDLLTLLGREEEALKMQRDALKLSPRSLDIITDMMAILGCLGEYEEAERVYHEAVEINPTFSLFYSYIGFIYALQGKYDEAIKAFKKVAQLAGYSGSKPGIGYVYALMGKRKEAEKILAEFPAEFQAYLQTDLQFILPRYELYIENFIKLHEFTIRLGLKDYNSIFETLESLYNERSPRIIRLLLNCKRRSKDIVVDPRWKALMKKMGLPED